MYAPSKDHFPPILLYEFHKRVNPSAAAKSPQSSYGDDAVNKRSCRRWFSRVRSGYFSLKDDQKEGCPKNLDSEELEAVVTDNPTIISRELAEQFHIDHITVPRQIKRIGKVSVVEKWVPHELSTENLQERFACCESLFSQLQAPFLGKLVTSDEKWILYNNVKRHRSWISQGGRSVQQPRGGLHPKNMLNV